MVTTTDLRASCEFLFAWSSPDTYRRLPESGWQVARIGGEAEWRQGCRWTGRLRERKPVLSVILASTSIPGVFPSQRIESHPSTPSADSVKHDFVDGGVLNNSPVNVTVDAGATHIISIELDPLARRRRSSLGRRGDHSSPRTCPTFSTLRTWRRPKTCTGRCRSTTLRDTPC